MLYLILSFVFFEESGLIKKWAILFKNDTVFIFYTLDKDINGFSEELKLLKLSLKDKRVKNKVIYKDKEGIDKVKLIESDKDYFLFFTLLRPLKEKKIKKNKVIFIFDGKKTRKIYELKKKNRFIYNVDFIFEKNNIFCVFDVGGKIYILDRKDLYEFGFGVNPVFFMNYILFLKGTPGKTNVLFKAEKGQKAYSESEILFDKEPVLAFQREKNYVLFLTDKDEDLLPEKVYIMDSLFQYKNIYDSNNHIIIMPSLDIQKDTIYILLSVSEEFTPNKLILIKMSNKIIEEKEIIKKEGIEAKWIKYPLFVLLQKTENKSSFELISLK